jgi:AraC family transcriptional regulator
VERFLRGIDFVEDNLFEPFTLDDVAEAAALSTYHFARTFRAILGETVMSYVRRRRLSIAAKRLVLEDIRILDLALASGFESQEAFSRAFKRQFHKTPGAWKNEGHRLMSEAFERPNLSHLIHRKEQITMEPKIIDIKEIKVIGMMANFNDETKQTIPDLWEAFAPRMGEIAGRIEGLTYGVCFPPALGDEAFDYMAALSVASFDTVPEGMVARTIPAHKFAVFTHKTGKDTLHNDLQKSVQYIWGTWLPNSGYEHAKVPDFELYDERMDPLTGKGEFDLYIPIK